MFLLVKNINDEEVIIGTARKELSVLNAETTGLKIYEISDEEYNPDMIYSKIEKFEEDI
jgi:hypothetical protein